VLWRGLLTAEDARDGLGTNLDNLVVTPGAPLRFETTGAASDARDAVS
jgi:hypothetical protein